MKTIKVIYYSEIPENFTGVVEVADIGGVKHWYKNGKYHREDGPAIEYSNESKSWYLEDKHYTQINLNDYVVLDHYHGQYNLIWYKLLDKDGVFEHPDVPGLITK